LVSPVLFASISWEQTFLGLIKALLVCF
jgi:hypothetical protein